MQDNEKLINIDRNIKSLRLKLEDVAVQTGGVFLDEKQTIKGNKLIKQIESLEKSIPEIKGDMIRIQGYTQSIAESEEQIEKCNGQLKLYENSLNSIYEKIGLDLFGLLTDNDLTFAEIKKACNSLKESEKKAEELESKLYKYENSVSKKKFLDNVLLPFKVGSLKKEIKKNDKNTLVRFRALGKAYTTVSEVVKNEDREPLLSLLSDYKSVYKLINSQIEKRALLNSGIEEKNKKILEDSKGLKLKTLYSNLENDIVASQKEITVKLGEFGHFLYKEFGVVHENKLVTNKLIKYHQLVKEITEKESESEFYTNKVKLNLIKREIQNREESIIIEEDHIKECKKKLSTHKKELTNSVSKLSELEEWFANNTTSEESSEK